VLPIPKRIVLKLLISILVVFSLGVGVAFATEIIDNRFKNLDDVEEYLQIPFLGLILAHSGRETRGLVMLTQPRSAVADGYRIVRTNIQMISTQRQLASLMITSAVAAEGKTTTTANLGVAFAQLGWRILLVDADLRRPALHTMFNMDQEHGLSDLLMKPMVKDISSFVKDTGVEDLKIITSGEVPRNPAELLSGDSITHICQSLREEFDLIVFDSAITLSIPDALIMSSYIDGVCLVHNPDCSDKQGVDTAKRMLERSQARVIGVMFNNIRLRTSTYGDYHYYSSTYTIDTVKKLN
jgi:capsular exopolysaccharide synthesis family protein